MPKPNPWSPPTFTGPAYGGPLTGSDIEHTDVRKEVWVLGKNVGAYVWDDDKWLWSPKGETLLTS